MDRVHLGGSEDVSRAGGNIYAAATIIKQAASTIDSAVANNMQFMSGWLERFEAAVDRLAEVQKNRLPEGWEFHD